MCKLYFKYGTMNSSKSANLLMIKHNYEEQGMKVFLLKSAIDDREKAAIVKSRVGISSPCYMLEKEESISSLNLEPYDVVMVDESQFLSPKQVEELYEVSLKMPVLCFGLLTDSNRKLFPGSARLVELAESFEKIKTICACGKAANYNARFAENGVMIVGGNQIEIGGNDKYKALCKCCYEREYRIQKNQKPELMNPARELTPEEEFRRLITRYEYMGSTNLKLQDGDYRIVAKGQRFHFEIYKKNVLIISCVDGNIKCHQDSEENHIFAKIITEEFPEYTFQED